MSEALSIIADVANTVTLAALALAAYRQGKRITLLEQAEGVGKRDSYERIQGAENMHKVGWPLLRSERPWWRRGK